MARDFERDPLLTPASAHLEMLDEEADLEAGRKGGAAYAATMAPGMAPGLGMDTAIQGAVWGRAITAGILGTAVMILVMLYVPLVMRLPAFDLPTLMGTMLVPRLGAAAFWTGTVWMLCNGALWALVYNAVLEATGRESTGQTGLVLGIVAWIAAMLLLPAILTMNPLVRSGALVNPGFFFVNVSRGFEAAGFALMAHLIFGWIVGSLHKLDPRIHSL